ncbi:MAG: dihydroorotase [bacterium]
MTARSPQPHVPILIQHARVVDPCARRDEVADLFIVDGMLQPVPAVLPADTRRIDARGLIATPGFLDLHVHFRDPGTPAAETLASGSRAAAAGGFTHVVTMPNTSPPCDQPEQVRCQLDPSLAVRILPAACITAGRTGGAVADLEALAAAGAAAFTDDGAMVADPAVMTAALRLAKKVNRVVMDHAVLPALAGNGVIRSCSAAQRYHLHVFPPEAEVAAVAQDIRLCRETGARIHIQHVSCAGSVAAIRAAQQAGLPVSGEASPHHIAIAAEDIADDDGNLRMNPPLGSRADLRALREAVLDGTLAAFATDHAPHAPEAKARGFLQAPSGVIGLETAAAVTYVLMVGVEQMPLADWVARWTTGPAAILGVPPPALAMGRPASLALFDIRKPWHVNPEQFQSLSRNCPFAGWTLHGKAMLTVCEGRVTWFDSAFRGIEPA